MEERYILTKRSKIILLIMMLIGVLSVSLGFVLPYELSTQVWANILINNIYFISVAVCGGVFLAIHKLSLSGWHTIIKRIPEAMTAFLPYSGIFMLLVLLGIGDLYHWTHIEDQDEILRNKAIYLNIPFFVIRMVVIIGGWIFFTYLLRKNTSLLDKTKDQKYFNKNTLVSGLFLVFFAISSSVASWDWIMSIDAHWYSTLFGWYYFSGLFVTGIAFIIILIAILKNAGLLKDLNQEHLHDMGKYLFAFSIFWAYLWFSQYLLIWYGHIPEETIYYKIRLDDFQFLFFFNLIINFVVPLFALMTNSSKRNLKWLTSIAVIVFLGHWVDIYLMVVPGVFGENIGISFIEIGTYIGYLGLFMFVILTYISKRPVVPTEDPFMKESLTYHN